MTFAELGQRIKRSFKEYRLDEDDEIVAKKVLEARPDLWDLIDPIERIMHRNAEPDTWFKSILPQVVLNQMRVRNWESFTKEATYINHTYLTQIATQLGVDVPTLLAIKRQQHGIADVHLSPEVKAARDEADHMLYAAKVEQQVDELRYGTQRHQPGNEKTTVPKKRKTKGKPGSDQPALTIDTLDQAG